MTDVEQGASLPADLTTLALGVPDRLESGLPDRPAPGMIYALSLEGGIAFGPKEGRSILFGRNRDDVHVCLGGKDRAVSREHGRLTHRAGRWWVDALGRTPVRLPGSRLVFPQDEPVSLPEGYTPLFVRGSQRREHLMELYVVPESGYRPPDVHTAATNQKTWALSEEERLVMVALAQRYLLHEEFPQPVSRREAAEALDRVQPDGKWSDRRVERIATRVRSRLSRKGVRGLTREEVGEPVGNALNHHLIVELLHSAMLVPPDLRWIFPDD